MFENKQNVIRRQSNPIIPLIEEEIMVEKSRKMKDYGKMHGLKRHSRHVINGTFKLIGRG